MARRIVKPIILLGSGRSGTTLLGEIFPRHPDVAYWGEPRPIWMCGHAYRSHHELSAADLTPAIARSIDRRFARFLARRNRSRFAEKTPSNCLRIPFIAALYPDCRVINIIRDGREVVASTLRMQAGPPRLDRVLARVVETPLWEWPAYLPLFFQTAWRTGVLKQRSTYWGVKPAGWQQWTGLPPHLLAAHQWKRVVEISIRDGRALPAKNYLEVRFARLLAEPVETVRQMAAFAELPDAPAMLDYAAGQVDASHAKTSVRDLNDQQVREIEDAMNPLLAELGFPDRWGDEPNNACKTGVMPV